MDAPDLHSLLQHFDHKIARLQQLVPWARTCNLLVQQHDAATMPGEQQQQEPDCSQLPDLRLLSDMILDMEESIYEIDDHLDMEKKKMAKQKVRIQNLVTDLNSHLDYISSNFPLNFGKSPEKPKTQTAKYGIHASAKKTSVQPVKSCHTGRTGNAAVRNGGKGTTAARPTKTGNTGAGCSTVRTNNNNKAPDKSVKPEPAARKSVAAPAVLCGPAIVGSKSSKPAIPVRMTKKFITRFNHNVNKN